MPLTQPTITVVALTSTTFRVTWVGGSVGAVNVEVRYRWQSVGATDVVAGTIGVVGGTLDVMITQVNGNFLLWCMGVDGSGDYSPPTIAGISLATDDSIGGAICRKFLADAGISTLCQQIWLNEIPEFDAAGQAILTPFVRLEVPDESPEWNFEAAHHDVDQCIMTVYADSSEEVDAICAVIMSSFNWKPLPFLTSTTVQAMEGKKSSGADEVRDRKGNLVSYATLEYQFMRTQAA